MRNLKFISPISCYLVSFTPSTVLQKLHTCRFIHFTETTFEFLNNAILCRYEITKNLAQNLGVSTPLPLGPQCGPLRKVYAEYRILGIV